jgi:hypothetical protein
MPIWNENPDSQCADYSANCQMYIGNLAVIMDDVAPFLIGPAGYLVDHLKKKVHGFVWKRLAWGMRHLVEQIQATANSLMGVMPPIPRPAETTPADVLAIASPPLAQTTGDLSPVQQIVVSPAPEHVYTPAPGSAIPADWVDRPDVYRFAQQRAPWHENAARWYGQGWESAITSESPDDEREQQRAFVAARAAESGTMWPAQASEHFSP